MSQNKDFNTNVKIQAKTEAEAVSIAQSMQSMSGLFTDKEWQKIAKKLQSKTVRMRIRILLT